MNYINYIGQHEILDMLKHGQSRQYIKLAAIDHLRELVDQDSGCKVFSSGRH